MATHAGGTGNDNIVIKNRTPLVTGYNITATSGSVTPNGNFSDTTLIVNAGNGREAVAYHARESFDLILMDCQMPEMDGYAAAEEIRRREEGGPQTPIVAMTASVLTVERQRCRECGMDDFLAKPWQPQELEAILARWCPSYTALPT